MLGFSTRLRVSTARERGIAASLALVAAIVLDRVGTPGRFDDFFIGVLFGLSVGLGVFALDAYRRTR